MCIHIIATTVITATKMCDVWPYYTYDYISVGKEGQGWFLAARKAREFPAVLKSKMISDCAQIMHAFSAHAPIYIGFFTPVLI